MNGITEDIKSRPAVVIGVGGTGQWVLAYLKKDLLESYNGKLPPNIRLLGLDTMPMSEGRVGAAGNAGQADDGDDKKNLVKYAGAVHLNPGEEFVYLGGDAWDIANLVKEGGHRNVEHIAEWFDAATYIKTLRRSDFILDDGAGRIRQLGHLAIAKDLLPGKANSKLYRTLEGALTTVAGNVGEKHVDVILVGSFAGGTGSGMFIDVALLARKICETDNISVSLRGYFVLPSAFAVHAPDMMARTFAAWRELNRFMSQASEIGSPKMVLAPRQKELEINTEKRLFDACYLVDAFLGNERLAAKPQKGIFPSIADAISTILDATAGGTYTKNVEKNLAPHFLNFPGQPMYSTLSTYTFKIPVYYYQEEYSYGLSKEILECLLAPRSQGDGRWILASDANRESNGRSGSSESIEILHAAKQEYKDQTAYPNLFTKEISDIAQNHNDGQLFQDHVKRATQSAKSGGRASGTWVDLFASFGSTLTSGLDRDRLEKIRIDLEQEVKFSLISALPTANVARDELRKQPEKIQKRADDLLNEHYGTPERPGSFNRLLTEVREFQFANFKRLVELWVLKTLNGSNRADPELALGGKVGFVASGLNGLISHLSNVEVFLSKVEKQRAAETPELEVEKRAKIAKGQAVAAANRTWFWGLITDPSAKPNLDNMRIILNRVGLLSREIAAFTEVKKTVQLMLEHTQQVKHDLDLWVQALLNDPTGSFEGLYPSLIQKLDEVRATHNEDQSLEVIQRLFEPKDVFDEDGRIANREALLATLGGVTWEYASDGLKLTISLPDREPIIIKRPGPKAKAELQEQIRKENQEALLALGRSGYATRTVTRSIAKRLIDDDGIPVYQDVVDILYPKFEKTLFRESAHLDANTSSKANSWYIRVDQTGGDPDYFTNIMNELNVRSGNTKDNANTEFPIETVGSANPHKMTAIRTADCWFPEAFVAWHDCLQAFRQEIESGKDVSLYQVYPAERNAVRLELEAMRKFPRERGAYRPFHPRVVMFLSHEERLENFLMCWILGYIQQQEGANNFYWQLNLPGAESLQLTRASRHEPEDILFRIINNFVLVQKDMKAGAAVSISNQAVVAAIAKAREELGLEKINELISFHTNPLNGVEVAPDAPLSAATPLIPWLNSRAAIFEETLGEQDELVAERPEYWDLSTVAQLKFAVELENNRKRLSARASQQPKGSGLPR